MKVKELISWLKKQNPEDYVGTLDYGQDTGDWRTLTDSKDGGSEDLNRNFKIIPRRFAENEIDKGGWIDDKKIQRIIKDIEEKE